jgi:hypothetical protein
MVVALLRDFPGNFFGGKEHWAHLFFCLTARSTREEANERSAAKKRQNKTRKHGNYHLEVNL